MQFPLAPVKAGPRHNSFFCFHCLYVYTQPLKKPVPANCNCKFIIRIFDSPHGDQALGQSHAYLSCEMIITCAAIFYWLDDGLPCVFLMLSRLCQVCDRFYRKGYIVIGEPVILISSLPLHGQELCIDQFTQMHTACLWRNIRKQGLFG